MLDVGPTIRDMRAVRALGNVLIIVGGIFLAAALWSFLVSGLPTLSDGLATFGIFGGLVVTGYFLRRAAIRRAAPGDLCGAEDL
jgi:uncharacterized membrane protein